MRPPAPSLPPPECRELLLQTAVPILQDLIEKGEEEDACIELLSNILEVLYRAQKVNPIPSAASLPLSSHRPGNAPTKPRARHELLATVRAGLTVVHPKPKGAAGARHPRGSLPNLGVKLFCFPP